MLKHQFVLQMFVEILTPDEGPPLPPLLHAGGDVGSEAGLPAGQAAGGGELDQNLGGQPHLRCQGAQRPRPGTLRHYAYEVEIKAGWFHQLTFKI